MLDYGRWQFWAAGRDEGSKVSRLDNLKQVEKSLGRPPKELAEAPQLRNELLYIWTAFVSLKNASDGPITYPAVTSYMQVFGKLSAFEIDAIMALDHCHTKEALDG